MVRQASWKFLLPTALAALLTGCGSTVIPYGVPGNRDVVITWNQPAPIDNPTPLSATQLDATANVAGTFVYSPAAGTVLAPGRQTLWVTFTPSDTSYNSGTAMVTLEVDEPGGGPPPMIASNLAVSDGKDSRVLIYLAPLSSGMSPSVVIGQKDLASLAPTIVEGATIVVGPSGLSMDGSGDLYVTDAGNCRVVRFPPPFTTFMNADLEVGVPSFTSPGAWPNPTCRTATPQSSLAQPSDQAVDAQGNLWAADPMSGRVLRFPNPLTSGMSADMTLGNTIDMTRDCNGVNNDVTNPGRGHPPPIPGSASATSLCYPTAVAFDASGNLWVADRGNNRVLEYAPPFSTGMAASVELGYAASVGMNSPFTGSSFHGDACAAVTAGSLCSPAGLGFDSGGNLWVADASDRRVLEFRPPFTSGMAAALVVGQPSLTQAAAGAPAANTVGTPAAVGFDSHGDLFVSDGEDNRILIYAPPFSDGMSAIVVLGQPSFASGGGSACAPSGGNRLCAPGGVEPY